MFEKIIFLAQQNITQNTKDALAAVVTLGILLTIFLLLLIAWWIYTSFAWSSIFKKLKHPKPYKAWIPFARGATILQLGEFSWQLIFLYLIPIIGWMVLWVLMIISSWRIYEKRNYPGWLALAPILVLVVGGLSSTIDLIILGIVAWRDQKKPSISKKPQTKKTTNKKSKRRNK